MFKKGSLSLSINAIVVLILAVTMLGLGLLFMQNMMGGAMGQLAGVSEEVENQMIQRMESGSAEVELRTANVRTRPSGSERDYFAVRNNRESDLDFNIEVHCNQAMDPDADVTDITFRHMPSTYLVQGDVVVLPLEVSANANAKLTTYDCAIFADQDTESNAELTQPVGTFNTNQGSGRYSELIRAELYAHRRFNVIVERR